MTPTLRRYDSLLPGIDSNTLKKMVTLWGGRSKLSKDDCIRWIRQALTDPQEIDAAIARMQRYERAVLGLMKLLGGNQDFRALTLALKVTGTLPVQRPDDRYYREDSHEKALLERGIVMTEAGYSIYSYGYYSDLRVFADERILARIEPLEHVPLPIKIAPAPAITTARRAQSVALDIIAMVRAVNDIGGISRTKTGELRVNDLRKFARKMGWSDRVDFDGLTFPEPARASLDALSKGGLLASDGGEREVGAIALDQMGKRPVGELLHSLVSGIVESSDWQEYDPGPPDYWIREHGWRARLATLAALCCLPDPRAWFRFDDFERALYDRIGDSFSVGGPKVQRFSFPKSPQERQAEEEKRRLAVREGWEKADVPWLQAALHTWLYAFGLVELGLTTAGRVERFRLTEAGRAVLVPASVTAEPQAPTEQVPAWIVQPNFDVIVYLDSVSTEQVAFLEQVAERVNMAQHTAQYRLTRDSVYEGLERGIDADRLLTGLAAGARIPLPGNVVAELRTWAALRERIIVRRQADLLEFPDASARQSALDRGLAGVPVGERFVLITGKADVAAVTDMAPEIINYADTNVPKCLRVSEEGLITLVAPRRDLLTPGYLDLWAERKSDTTWQLTRASVTDTVRRGRTLRELLMLLQSRSTQSLPKILTVALSAWTGESVVAGMVEAVVLQCTHSEALEALLASQALKPHLLGRIGPNALLVKRESIGKVREILDWAGLQTTAKIVPQRH